VLGQPPRGPEPQKGQKQRRLTPEQVERLVAHYTAGARQVDLAKTFEISTETVRAHLQRAGAWRQRA
jgi:DNA-directed RNA polymerase specialized sigma24 family protein